MNNGYIRKGGLTAVAIAFVALVAWRAPEPRAAAAPAATAVSAPAAASTVLPVASFAPIVERAEPAVVTIRVEKKVSMQPTFEQMPDDFFQRFFGQQLPQQTPRGRRMPQQVQRGVGSGVIVSQDGYVLTNNHVVDGADTVQVDLPDNRQFTAKVVGTDPATDLAVVKVNATSLPTLPFGDSDQARVGDFVLAIGDPLDVGQTVTQGIISAKGRTNLDGNADNYEDFIQTDAPINHGNSGGALVNTNGQLIGINSEILSPNDANIGLGFAIPSNMAKNVMNQLITSGKVRRAKLGVLIQAITPDMATAMNLPNTQGAIVASVDAGSPAAHAGIKQGDVITEYNGRPVKDYSQLRNEVASTSPGSSVAVKVLRDGRPENFTVTLGELESTSARSGGEHPGVHDGSGKFGMTIQPLTSDEAGQIGVPSGTHGVLVTDVDPDGAAASNDIEQGDVIVKVNGHAVTSVDQLKSALDDNAGKPSLLLVQRKDQQLFRTLKAQ
jgi:serine protease Do